MSVQSRCHDGKLLFHRNEVMLCVLYVQSKLAYIVWPVLSRLTDRKHNADLSHFWIRIAQWVLDPVLQAFIPAGLSGGVSIWFLFDNSFICSYLNHRFNDMHCMIMTKAVKALAWLRWLFLRQTRPVRHAMITIRVNHLFVHLHQIRPGPATVCIN